VLSVPVAQRHRVDHQQVSVIELNRHHLKRNLISIVAEVDKAQIGTCGTTGGRWLLETQTAMLDDVARAITRFPMSGSGTSPSDLHGRRLTILSDNISEAEHA
jgi:hypothetical protein